MESCSVVRDMVLADENSLVNRYLEWVESQSAASGDSAGARDAAVVFDSRPHGNPFLSVVMRTQGKRIEELRQAVSSLQNQQNRDFELIVVGHKVSGEGVSAVREVLDGADGWLKERMVFATVDGGTRSRPLNAAIPFMRGVYFAALDEDDLVYGNWVSSFFDLAARHPGHVLYCFVETQQWRVRQAADGSRTLYALKEQKGLSYCHAPNDFQLLFGNQCPFMGLAFPTQLVCGLGFRFNEEIETTEDWDFFRRARNVYPLACSHDRVALYRLWSDEGGYSTRTVDRASWENDNEAVRKTGGAMPLLLAAGFDEQARSAIGDAWSEESFLVRHMELFVDTGVGFDAQHRTGANVVAGKRNTYAFEGLDRFGLVGAVRIDPQPHGPLALMSVRVEVHPLQGDPIEASRESITVNGRVVAGQYEFPGDDPQIVVTLVHPLVIDKVIFSFERATGFHDLPARPRRSIFRR